jgi:hypothetical protein
VECARRFAVDVAQRYFDDSPSVIDGSRGAGQISQLFGAYFHQDGNLPLGKVLGEFPDKIDLGIVSMS